MNRLERRYRRLLLAYPRAYRRARADEIVDTYLALAPPDRRWPTVRETADVVRHGLRARLGRPASPHVVAWSLVAATICGLFGAAAGSFAAWQATPPADGPAAAAVLAAAVPDHRFTLDRVDRGSFVVYGEPAAPGHVDDLLLGDGGELVPGGAHFRASTTGTDVLYALAGRLRADGWRAGRPYAETPTGSRLSAVRGDTVLELEAYLNQSGGADLEALVRARTPGAVWPGGIGGGLAAAAVGWLLLGWAARRADRLPVTRYALANLAFAATMVLWWLPAVVGAAGLADHHVREDHAQWHPLWQWLGQPMMSLFLVAGCATALAGLVVAAAPHTQVRRAASHPRVTTAGTGPP